MFSYSVGKNDLKHVLKSKRSYLQKRVFLLSQVKSIFQPKFSWLQSTFEIHFLRMLSLFSRNRGKKKNRLPSYIQIPNIRGNNILYFNSFSNVLLHLQKCSHFVVFKTVYSTRRKYLQISYYLAEFTEFAGFTRFPKLLQNSISRRRHEFHGRNDRHLCF